MWASALTLSLPCHWLGVGWQRKKKKQAHTNHHSHIKMCQHVSWLAVVSCHANAFVPPLPCLPEWSSVNSPSFQQLHRHSAFFGLPVHTQIINHKIICDLERTPQKKKKKKGRSVTLSYYFQAHISNLSGPSNIEFHCVLGITALNSRAPGKFAKSLQKTHRQRNYSAEQCFIKSCGAAVCRHRRVTRGPRRKRPSETKQGGWVAPLTLFTTKNKEIEPRARWQLCRYCGSRQIWLTHKLSWHVCPWLKKFQRCLIHNLMFLTETHRKFKDKSYCFTNVGKGIFYLISWSVYGHSIIAQPKLKALTRTFKPHPGCCALNPDKRSNLEKPNHFSAILKKKKFKIQLP